VGGANRPTTYEGGGSSRPTRPTPGTGPNITSRANHVEPDRDGFWWADMKPSSGPVLGPHGSRSEALGAERE
jgi:hypothetical protein